MKQEDKDLCKTCKHYWQDFPLPLDHIEPHCEIVDERYEYNKMIEVVPYPCLECPFYCYIKFYMTQEEKQLLLQDLCARLPYGVVVVLDEKFGFNKGTRPLVKELLDLYCVEGMKPYLRPMSSMTEEECDMVEEILGDKCIFDFMGNGDIILKQGQFSQNKLAKLYDYYNSIHVDYRGLIEKGLAIAVTEENNPYEK